MNCGLKCELSEMSDFSEWWGGAKEKANPNGSLGFISLPMVACHHLALAVDVCIEPRSHQIALGCLKVDESCSDLKVSDFK